MRKWLTSNLLRRILLAMLIVSLIPLGIIANFSLRSYTATKSDVVDQSRVDLDQKSLEGLQARTLSVANTVSAFLRERENDVRQLAVLPRTAGEYLTFARSNQARIWTITGEEKEVTFELPLYRQIAFIGTDGKPVILVSNECVQYPFSCTPVVSNYLLDMRIPANNLYQDTTYLTETLKLEPGQIYIGKPIGGYVPYERAYAGAQNRGGERYRGVLHFAMPVFDSENGKRLGIVVASLELLHLIELTAHVAPANPNLLAEIDPRETDFAYLVDPRGSVLAHPRHYNIAGVDLNGIAQPPIQEQDRTDPNNLYRPGNLAQMGFIDASFPTMVEQNQTGVARTGKTLFAHPWGGRERALAYATVPYYAGQYNTPAGFGMLVMSTDGLRFHLEAQLLGKQIENRIGDLIIQLQIVGGITLVATLLLSALLSRGVAWPILRLTDAARLIEKGEWESTDLATLAKTKGSDEIASLARVFAAMATQVHTRELEYRRQVQQLQIVIDETKRERAVAEITDTDFFQDLTEKAQKMRRQRHSHPNPTTPNEPPSA